MALASGAGGTFFGVVDWCGVAGATAARDVASFVDLAVDDTSGVPAFKAAAVSLRVGWPLSLAAVAVWVPPLTADAKRRAVFGVAVADTTGGGEVELDDG